MIRIIIKMWADAERCIRSCQPWLKMEWDMWKSSATPKLGSQQYYNKYAGIAKSKVYLNLVYSNTMSPTASTLKN